MPWTAPAALGGDPARPTHFERYDEGVGGNNVMCAAWASAVAVWHERRTLRGERASTFLVLVARAPSTPPRAPLMYAPRQGREG